MNQPTTPTWPDVLRAIAHAVPCPTCRAPIAAPCDAPRKDGMPHAARQARGVSASHDTDDAQHVRAVAAWSRVRAAGRTANQSDVTIALACGCSECRDDTLAQAAELHRLRLLDVETPR